jgi:hypothetical protein
MICINDLRDLANNWPSTPNGQLATAVLLKFGFGGPGTGKPASTDKPASIETLLSRSPTLTERYNTHFAANWEISTAPEMLELYNAFGLYYAAAPRPSLETLSSKLLEHCSVCNRPLKRHAPAELEHFARWLYTLRIDVGPEGKLQWCDYKQWRESKQNAKRDEQGKPQPVTEAMVQQEIQRIQEESDAEKELFRRISMADRSIQMVREWLQGQPFALRMLTLILFMLEAVEENCGAEMKTTIENNLRVATRPLQPFFNKGIE